MIAGGWKCLEETWSRILQLVFPPVCCHCCCEMESGWSDVEGDQFPCVHLWLCPACQTELAPSYRRKCSRCGAGFQRISRKPFVSRGVSEVNLPGCFNCHRQVFNFQRCFSLGNYELGVRDAILRIKSGHFDSLVVELAKLLAKKTVNQDFDVVVPIPIHWRRRLGRKTVVSGILAEQLARIRQEKFVSNALRCTRLTKKQGTLPIRQRMKNVRNSISVVKPRKISGKKLLIVDDVMTSGATLTEATASCLKAGAQSVSVAVVARGVGRAMVGKK